MELRFLAVIIEGGHGYDRRFGESYAGFATPASQERIANTLRQVGLPE